MSTPGGMGVKVDEGSYGEKELILTKNYAKDKEVAGRALEHVNKIWNLAYDARSELNRRYDQYYNIWNTIFDIRYYEGRSQVYSPQLRKNVEFAVRNLRRNLFPTDDYFGVEAVGDDVLEEDPAGKLYRFSKWQQINKIKIKRYVTPFLRQLVMYGWSPVKVIWLEETKKIFTHIKQQIPRLQKTTDPFTGLEQLEQVMEEAIVQVEKEVKTKQHPSFLPIDIFSFYIYPHTIWDANEAYAVMEEIPLSKEQLYRSQEKGMYFDIDEVIKITPSAMTARKQWSKEQRLYRMGVSEVPVSPKVQPWQAIEYWGKFDLLDNGHEIDCVITVAEHKKVIQVRQNTNYDQEPPYLVAKLDELVGDFYGKGLIEPLQTMQYLLNDEKNQINDSLIFALSPIVKYDPGAVVNHKTLVISPGALWALNDVNSAVFEKPPDIAQSGILHVQQLQQEIDEYPGFERIPSTGRRPATQVAALQQDRGVSILDWSENIEVQVMSPFLQKQFMLNQQYLDDEVWFKVVGAPPEKMAPEDLVGNYHFYWLGANQTQNLVVKSRQMIDFLNVAMAIPPTVTEQPDLWYIAKRIWKEGLGLDGEHNLTHKIDVTTLLTPDQENMIMMFGKQVPINELDNDQQHIQSHSALLQIPEMDDFVKMNVQRHIQGHMNKMMRAQAMMGQGQNGKSQGSPARGEQQLSQEQAPPMIGP